MGQGAAFDCVGRYGASGTPGVAIVERNAGLWFRLPGAPESSDLALEPVADDEFRVARGQLSSLPLSFRRDASGAVVAMTLARAMELRVNPDTNPVDYTLGPPLATDAAVLADFERLYEREVLPADGRCVDYALQYPVHEFLDWLCSEKKLLAHGSNVADIRELRASRKTLGTLQDQSDRGLSACADALWAMAYAVLDRARIRGAFHNLALSVESGTGRVRLYHFSIAHECLAQDPPPFTQGSVYLTTRDGFSRVAPGLGLGLQEWTSTTAVRPLAHVRVAPADFPLLAAVRGHDDRGARRYLQLRGALFAECKRADALDDGYVLHFAHRADLARDLAAFCRVLRAAYPWIVLQLDEQPGSGSTLSLRGSTGLRDAFDKDLQHALAHARDAGR